MKVNYKKNIMLFLELKKIVESYMKVRTYTNLTQKVRPMNNNN